MTYLRNCWYLAAWSTEIEAGGLLARRFLDEPVVLFRDSEGKVSAVFDRCPHRFAPLSMGKVSSGAIACGYHGLAFDGQGQCVLNPHGPILKNMAIKHYPIAEAYRGIWIWMGDPDAADPALLRDLSFMDEAPDTAFSSGYLYGKGNFQLYVDNILDLTHADYLHATTLGSGAFTRTQAKVTETGDRLSIKWDCLNEVPSPAIRASRGLGDNDRVDFWNYAEWSAPAVLTLTGGNVPAGAPRENCNTMMNAHIMTPETPTTTHYFFASTRDFLIDDAEFNERLAQTRHTVFTTEDKPMINAQYERMEGKDLLELQPLLLRTDEGGVRVRRKLASMIEAEALAANGGSAEPRSVAVAERAFQGI